MTNATGTVWGRLREYAATQTDAFSSQEAISWFARHYPGTNDNTLRVHMRNASWNVGNRSWASGREPFLARVERGVFRRATDDEIEKWRVDQTAPTARQMSAGSAGETGGAGPGPDEPGFEWHSEEHTQSLLVEWLKNDGWNIVRAANTRTREPGVDVIAERGDERLGVEVKGFPSPFYVTGPKKGLVKPTTPVEQAKKWYSHALVPAMRLRTREPESRSVMCFPDFPVYQRLYEETASSLRAAAIEVWFVTEAGDVSVAG
ncbi:DUF7669 domain-containing protein [Nocardioides daphniae]|uniref:DUF7669 domain-containing protein n=1 Tax=Nocardioides daphniae TaxID=402297 RepID=A0A4P7U863_9ACTN|nr:hypothetical protein [Nocardioides daphniae]QCC76353.1 hypothetical protein E2C04_02475 [Nocardioides daphniae]GGD07656.1 hypothetical protein GCM10007231_02950 [Nocardioides daphniae]